MPFLAGISSFFDKYILGYAIGTAAGPSLEPFVQDLANAAWRENQVLPVDPETAAGIVAENVELNAWGVDQAAQSGINADNFSAILGEALNAPGTGPLFEMWRRGLIDTATFEHGLRKAKYETLWDAPLEGLHDRLLSPQELAAMQQQQFIDAARANSEGALQGMTEERQQLLFEINGLPPGIAEGLTMWRRGIIDQATFDQIVAEGHTKTKYTAALEELKAQVLTANDYVNARVRGWIDTPTMNTGGELTGYSADQMNTLFQNHGRPLSWHQIFIGLQRGGVYDGPTADVDPAFLKGLQESDIRPEWYNLAWAQRYSYPAPFVLRTLATTGEIDAPTLEQTLKFIGWEPTFITKVVAAWTGGTTTTAAQKKQTLSHLTDEYLSGALTEAALTTVLTTSLGYTAEQAAEEIKLAEFGATKAARTKNTKLIEKQYVAVKSSEATARQQLAELGWPANVIDNYIAAWNIERDIQVTTLTVAQIAAALKAGALLASQATPLLQDLGEDANAIATIIATAGANPAT